MAAFNLQYTMYSVTNHAEPTIDPQVLSNPRRRVLPGPSKSSGLEGCFACRWRKKKCKPVIGIAPSPSHPCSDCAKFDIRCEGGGLERPAGKDLAKTICRDLRRWIRDKKNCKRRQPFDLTPYYDPQTSAPVNTSTAPATTTHTVHQESPPVLGGPSVDPTYLTRVILPSPYAGDRTSHSGASSGQIQSSSANHYAVYPSGVQSNNQNCFPALGELNHFHPHVSNPHGFQALDVRDRWAPSGSSERGYIAPNDHHSVNQPFVAHNMQYFYPGAEYHNWGER